MNSPYRGPVHRLRALGDAWARIFETDGARDGILRAFVASRDPLELPSLLRLVLSSEPVAADAAGAIHDYLDRLSPRDLVVLDDALRQAFRWSSPAGSAWEAVRPADVGRLGCLGAHAGSVLGLASFHPSGYVREVAVRELADVRRGDELPFLLIRLNDWVKPVQDAAYSAVRERLVPEYASHLVKYLWLLARLERGARTGHAALAGQARTLLSRPACRSALHEGLDASDRWLRRSCYGLLLDTPAEDTPAVIRRALRDEDTIIRLRSAQRATEFLQMDDLRALIAAMSRDPFMAVRREALQIWSRYFPEDAEPQLHRALLDRHAAIREIARQHLRQRGIAHFREFYRSILDQPKGVAVRSALYGLGETGTTDDAGFVERFLSHPTPGVRRAAVTALARLAPEARASAFYDALEDPSPGVSTAARRALANRRGGVERERLWETFLRNPQVHVRSNSLSLLAGLGKWEAAGWIIRASGVEDERVARLAHQHLQRWMTTFNRNQTRPTADELKRMAHAIDEHAPVLGEATEQMLRFLMKGF